jgi:hypothetical protein
MGFAPDDEMIDIRAQLAYTESIMNGEAASALGAYFGKADSTRMRATSSFGTKPT